MSDQNMRSGYNAGDYNEETRRNAPQRRVERPTYESAGSQPVPRRVSSHPLYEEERTPRRVSSRPVGETADTPRRVSSRPVGDTAEAPRRVSSRPVGETAEAPRRVSSRPVGETAEAPRRVSSHPVNETAEAPRRVSSPPVGEGSYAPRRAPVQSSNVDRSLPRRDSAAGGNGADENAALKRPSYERRVTGQSVRSSAGDRRATSAGSAARATAAGQFGASARANGQTRRADDGSGRPTASTMSARYGAERSRQTRAFEAPLRKVKLLSTLPEWAQLSAIALVILALIGVTLRVITTSGSRTDRTIIMPIVSGTVEPETPEQVVSAAVTADPNLVVAVDDAAATVQPEEGQNAAENQADQNDQTVVEPTTEPASDEPGVSATNTPAALTPVIPVEGRRSATIRMAGDVIIDTEMLEYSYNKVTDEYNFAPFFEMIGDTLSSPDYTMINIEASLRRGKYGYSGYPQFTTPPIILRTLQNLGCDMITMCNNHMLDGYCDGLVESVGYVDTLGLGHIGGFVDEADAEEPEIYEIGGISVGFVTYTQVTNSVENYCDDRYKFLVKYLKKATFDADIAKARRAGAEVIVAVTHWGEEYKTEPESSTRRYAEQLVAAGADIIIGGHPHLVQPAEYITATDSSGNARTALCLYSLGNFLSQHYKVKDSDGGIVLEFSLIENEDGTISVANIGYVPVFVWRWPAVDANGNTRKLKGETIWELRVMPILPYVDNRPSGMSDESYNRMTEYLNSVTNLMGGDSVITRLAQ